MATACLSCVGSGAATPAASVPPGVCARCCGSGVEPAPGAVGVFRVDVVSVADPDRPFLVACFEADSREAALVVAGRVVAEHATNPDLHYGDLYEYTPAGGGSGRMAYVGSIEPPAAGGGRVRCSERTGLWSWCCCGACGFGFRTRACCVADLGVHCAACHPARPLAASAAAGSCRPAGGVAGALR
jgi:hypothetical protein